MAVGKIQTTKNYALFTRSEENRPTNLKKHRKLEESMKLYGFLKSFPIVCVRNDAGQLIVKDGQHRLMIAQALGLPVSWVEESVDFDVALVNSTAKVWVLRDYAEKHAANGNRAYAEGLDFADRHGLPIGTSFCLLAGTISFSNIITSFIDGDFRVKDRAWADTVAGVYGPMTELSSSLKSARFIEACMGVARVPGFDTKRLLTGAERCRDKLVSYSTKDAYLDMLEEVYNFGRKQLVGLKAEAMNAMRQRNAATKKKSDDTKAA